MADTAAGNWVNEDGSYVTYDAVNRYWFRQAVEAGELVFSDVEYDHRTGELCVTCAMPVYDTDGELLGVAGEDLYLDELQKMVTESTRNGGLLVVVNQMGHVIMSPDEEGIFRVMNSSEAEDLRDSDNEELAALVRDAMQGKTDVRQVFAGRKLLYDRRPHGNGGVDNDRCLRRGGSAGAGQKACGGLSGDPAGSCR